MHMVSFSHDIADAQITAVIPAQDKLLLETIAVQNGISRNEVLRRVLSGFRSAYTHSPFATSRGRRAKRGVAASQLGAGS